MKIDKGVPIPITKRGRPSKYPFGEMDLGDSFYAPVKRMSIYQLTRRFAPKKFTVLDEGDGCRCWRIK